MRILYRKLKPPRCRCGGMAEYAVLAGDQPTKYYCQRCFSGLEGEKVELETFSPEKPIYPRVAQARLDESRQKATRKESKEWAEKRLLRWTIEILNSLEE